MGQMGTRHAWIGAALLAACVAAPGAWAEGEVTYSNQIARVMQKHCNVCHRDQGIAPMSFSDYATVRKFAPMIKEVVQQRRMPPWHADPNVGHFSNARNLSDEEISMIGAWVDNRAPRGNDADLPAPLHFDGAWSIGTPDVIFEMPEEVSVEADGTVPYLYFETPTNFTEDKWVRAVQAVPGNDKVVHHIIVFMKDERGGARGSREGRDGSLGIGKGFLKGFAPGVEPMILPEDMAVKIPAGTTLVWQMHYTATGKPETDRSRIGMVFADGPPKFEHKTATAATHDFAIPAGADNYKVETEYVFADDATLLDMTPHMHVRGKSYSYTAIFPDGREELLLSVPRYDFNWQNTYRLAKPLFMPKGSKLHCVAHFDNSTANPANPDPSTTVYWGDQTWEEMMIGWFSLVWGDRGEGAGHAQSFTTTALSK
ncbi:MAG: hypothetical protein HYV27_02860 [Candidatus Hydrogenedentes bacterium]|nr:hypothetical protein [Candidatus Hydrogenedentota bacterium]